MSMAKTSIRPGNGHEWEAVIVWRGSGPYKIKISRRAYIRSTMSDEIHVQPGLTRTALTLDGARRKAQRMVERRNRRDRLNVPIARAVEVKLQTARTPTDSSGERLGDRNGRV